MCVALFGSCAQNVVLYLMVHDALDILSKPDLVITCVWADKAPCWPFRARELPRLSQSGVLRKHCFEHLQQSASVCWQIADPTNVSNGQVVQWLQPQSPTEDRKLAVHRTQLACQQIESVWPVLPVSCFHTVSFIVSHLWIRVYFNFRLECKQPCHAWPDSPWTALEDGSLRRLLMCDILEHLGQRVKTLDQTLGIFRLLRILEYSYQGVTFWRNCSFSSPSIPAEIVGEMIAGDILLASVPAKAHWGPKSRRLRVISEGMSMLVNGD